MARLRAAAAIWLFALTVSAAPNIILLSIDDGLTTSALQFGYNLTVVASGTKNPNGCLPPITWFANGKSKCDGVMRAYGLGHEIATHTVSHKRDDKMSYATWLKEAGGQRDAIVKCGVPKNKVNGFRAPYFVTNIDLGRALQKLGFFYDSSLKPKTDFLPAPLNKKFSYTCQHSTCKGWDQFSFWEVPTYTLQGSVTRTDPAPLGGKSILKRLQEDFNKKKGTGVAVSFMTHEKYLKSSSVRKDLVAFLKWAMAQPDTWAITYQQYIAWVQRGGLSKKVPVANVMGKC